MAVCVTKITDGREKDKICRLESQLDKLKLSVVTGMEVKCDRLKTEGRKVALILRQGAAFKKPLIMR